jgi:catechol 2,3-dioxygenase-like lactoylglutathione lyase family enzyme
MSFPPASLDHVVIDVRDEMDEATRIYRALGFQLTPIGRHSLGTINHLAMFDSNYLELLGYERGVTDIRADVASYPPGLNGLVFGTEDSAATYAAMKANGVPIQEPVEFFRPVDLPDGTKEDARFRTVRLPRGTIPGVRAYFCHHLTKHLVWRAPWLNHANGTHTILGVVIIAQDPAETIAVFEKMFGAAALSRQSDALRLTMSNATIDIIDAATFQRRYGDTGPAPQDRTTYMAALILKPSAGVDVARALHGSSVAVGGARVVPAGKACNATLVFVT